MRLGEIQNSQNAHELLAGKAVVVVDNTNMHNYKRNTVVTLAKNIVDWGTFQNRNKKFGDSVYIAVRNCVNPDGTEGNWLPLRDVVLFDPPSQEDMLKELM